jgi:hypothetical protein
MVSYIKIERLKAACTCLYLSDVPSEGPFRVLAIPGGEHGACWTEHLRLTSSFLLAKDQSDILTFIVVRPVSLLWNEPNPLEVLIPKNIGIGKT